MKEMQNKEEKLFGYACVQGGYFTAKQAVKAGYSYRMHAYHVKSGHWVKIKRGVFRLRNYPSTEREDLIWWTLWSRNRKDEPQVVVSHESALAVHELSDVSPAKFHFTVPPGFRKKPPQGCVFFRAKLEPQGIEPREGYRVTTPLQTLIDVAEGNLSEDELHKALKDALNKGLVQLKQIHANQMTQRGKLRILAAIKAVQEIP